LAVGATVTDLSLHIVLMLVAVKSAVQANLLTVFANKEINRYYRIGYIFMPNFCPD